MAHVICIVCVTSRVEESLYDVRHFVFHIYVPGDIVDLHIVTIVVHFYR